MLRSSLFIEIEMLYVLLIYYFVVDCLDLNVQELEKLSQKFSENVLDATKKFEKLMTDKKEIEGLPATSLGLAAQTAVSKVFYVKIFQSLSLVH